MYCAGHTSSETARRQNAGIATVTNWFTGSTFFKGFSKQWRAAVGSLAWLPDREYPTPTGQGRP
jgi:hypothetical protein